MSKIGDGKTILLGMPEWFMYNEIKSNLERLGFKVYGIPFTNKFQYKTYWERLYNLYRKVIYNDRSYKTYLKYRDFGQSINLQLQNINDQLDYGVIIRPDAYPESVLINIKSKVKKMIGYQWDGLRRFTEINKLIPMFDKFYAFDPEDVNNTTILPATNFYFNDEKISNVFEKRDIDVYYLGNFVKSRMDKIRKLAFHLQEIDSKSTFKIYCNKLRYMSVDTPIIQYLDQYVSYEDNMASVFRSNVLVDFLHDVHKGLSFRVFESIGYEKKLITDNVNITNYDFFNPQNIFVLKDDNYEGLAEFLRQPYVPLPVTIKEKYAFDNWIKYVLDIEGHIPITLPQK